MWCPQNPKSNWENSLKTWYSSAISHSMWTDVLLVLKLFGVVLGWWTNHFWRSLHRKVPKPGVLSRASTKDTPPNFRTVIPSSTRRLKRSFASASENGAAHQAISTSIVFLCLPLTHFAPKTAVASEFQSDPWLSMDYNFVMYVNNPSLTQPVQTWQASDSVLHTIYYCTWPNSVIKRQSWSLATW